MDHAPLPPAQGITEHCMLCHQSPLNFTTFLKLPPLTTSRTDVSKLCHQRDVSKGMFLRYKGAWMQALEGRVLRILELQDKPQQGAKSGTLPKSLLWSHALSFCKSDDGLPLGPDTAGPRLIPDTASHANQGAHCLPSNRAADLIWPWRLSS